MKTLSILLTDFYKFCHQAQYDPSIKKLVSYGTPRGCRLPNKDYVINFGIQAFCKEYLIDHFNENFFSREDNEVEKEVTDFLTNTLPGTNVEETVKRLMELKKLGYLPLSIRTIPEGCKVNLKCPNIELVNTLDGFEWVSGFIESLISSYIWKPMICATVGHWYRKTSNMYFKMTADDWKSKARSSMSEFGFRGADTPEDGIHSGAAWLLSFDKTATCAAIPFVKEYYGTPYAGKGLISTEHSVMCSSTSLNMTKGMDQKDAEKEVVRNLLTNIYPNSSFSMVSDSYDYWRMVTEILPELKDEVMNHNGTLFVRGDSGDPVKIVSGYIDMTKNISGIGEIKPGTELPISDIPGINKSVILRKINGAPDNLVFNVGNYGCIKGTDGLYYKLKCNESGRYYVDDKIIPSYVAKGTVESLWDIFGGTINSKGYRVLDSHIRAIYGDSITQQRQEMIYKILELKGFSVENVALGAGSFSFHAYQGSDGTLYPYTRDTFQFAQKATYGESVERAVGSSSDGSGGLQMYEKRTPIMIYKDPKTDSDNFKKSMKGCCAIYQDENNSKYYLDHDNMTFEERERDSKNVLIEVFRDGSIVHEDTFEEIRNRLNNNEF